MASPFKQNMRVIIYLPAYVRKMRASVNLSSGLFLNVYVLIAAAARLHSGPPGADADGGQPVRADGADGGAQHRLAAAQRRQPARLAAAAQRARA